ncbi:MAG: type II toxin-antitoxin system VapC family toxin [Candidatus Aminicenantes bacterium]|nr:type II toxin-antitoxin system VapC family toxin [Candidatus Aminicenantes bacterium]
MKTSAKAVVIDASIALKWYLADEELGEKALRLLDFDLVTPPLLAYEVANGLVIARRRGRIDPGLVVRGLEGFHGLGIEMKEISALSERIVSLAEKYRLTAYDASYLALAESEGLEFVTADGDLHQRVKGDLAWVRLLSDFSNKATRLD